MIAFAILWIIWGTLCAIGGESIGTAIFGFPALMGILIVFIIGSSRR